MITDRDIAIRGVAEGKGPDAKIRDIMTSGIKYVFEDEELERIYENMVNTQMRRCRCSTARSASSVSSPSAI